MKASTYLIFVLVTLLLQSCDFNNESIIDNASTPPYIIESVVNPASINVSAVPSINGSFDTTLSVSVLVGDNDGTSNIKGVYVSVLTPDNNEIETTIISNNNNGRFSSDINVHFESIIIGNYIVKFQSFDKNDLAGTSVLQFLKVFNADNHPPVISNVVAFDTVKVPTDEDTNFVKISVRVNDVEGLSDIVSVHFTSKRPDGSTVGTYNLYDDGNLEIHEIYKGYFAISGDDVNSDGIYTVTLPIIKGTTTPTFRDFEFQARDQSNAASNVIIKRIYLQ